MNNRKTLFLESFRNIKKRFISFLSIVTIMALGISGLMALFNLEISLKKKGDDYYKEHNLKDFEIVASKGITEADIDEVKRIKGVSDAEAVFRADAGLVSENGSGAVTVISETKRIDLPILRDGEMPVAENECALNITAMDKYNVAIGDSITLSVQEPEGILKQKEFIVTGLIDQPSYIGRTEYVAVLPKIAFDKDVTKGRYIALLIKTDVNPNLSFYSSAYKKYVNRVKAGLDAYASDAAVSRTKELKDEADSEYKKAEEEAGSKLKEAEEQLNDGEKQLKDKVAEAEEEIAKNEKLIAEGREKLEKETAEAKKKIADAEKTLNEKTAEARKQIDEKRAQAEEEFESAYQKLNSAQADYNSGERKYNEGAEKVDEANKELVEKMEANSGNIDAYAGILIDALDGANSALDQLETKHSDLTGNENWNNFRTAIYIAQGTAAGFTSLSAEERVEFVKGLIQLIDQTYQDLPYPDEVKAALKGVFDSVAANHPKMDELKTNGEKIKELIDAESDLAEAKKKLDSGKRDLDSGWSTYWAKKTEANEKFVQAEKDLEAARADGERQIAEAKSQLKKKTEEAEAKLKDAEEQLKKGKEDLERTKAEKEKELKDGWDTYYEKKDEAEEKLADAKETIATIGTDNYIVNDRNLTSSYMEFGNSVSTCGKFEYCFLPLFALVAGTVFFSTIAIIIEEQKKQVGAVKALGFYNKEILVKYVMFAGLGSVFGILIGLGAGYVLTALCINPICNSYSFGDVSIQIAFGKLIVISGVSLLVGIIVAFMACRKLLKCSAVGLINGSEPAGRVMKGSKNSRSKKGNLYTKLIVNNIRMDWERVLVSVVVIAGSTTLIGFGFTAKYAFNKANERQLGEINNYTIQAVFKDGDEDSLKKVEAYISAKSGSSMGCRYMTGLIDMNGKNEALLIVSGEPDAIADYFTIKNSLRKTVKVPESGILIPAKCSQRLHSPDTVTLYDKKLYSYKAAVAGDYEQYLGFVAFTSVQGYEEIYEKEFTPNCLFIRCDSVALDELEKDILSVSDDIKLYRPNYLVTKGENVKKLFDIVTLIFVSLAVILSFMILINLTSILVSRRMKEMLVMRINGFSLSETIGYVARESVLTFVIGVIAGTILGVAFCLLLVPVMEANQIMFVRTPYALAWVYSLLFNIAFTVMIDSIAFRRIIKTPVTDITKY